MPDCERQPDLFSSYHRAWHFNTFASVTLDELNQQLFLRETRDYQHLQARFALINSFSEHSHQYQ